MEKLEGKNIVTIEKYCHYRKGEKKPETIITIRKEVKPIEETITIKKIKGSKDEITQIVTVEEEGKQPEINVTLPQRKKIPEKKETNFKVLPQNFLLSLVRTNVQTATLKPVNQEKIFTEVKLVVLNKLKK